MAKPEDQDRHEGLSAAQSVAESNQMTLVGVDASIIDPDVIIMEPNAAAPLGAEDVMFLELADLLPDESGEVVLFAGDDVPVNILASEPVTDAGIADVHVTATGLDVTGLHFYSFESGITVYSPTDLLIVNEPSSI